MKRAGETMPILDYEPSEKTPRPWWWPDIVSLFYWSVCAYLVVAAIAVGANLLQTLWRSLND